MNFTFLHEKNLIDKMKEQKNKHLRRTENFNQSWLSLKQRKTENVQFDESYKE